MTLSEVAAQIAASKPTLFRRAFVFAGSFDPFAVHHREIVEKLVELKNGMRRLDPDVPVEIIVWPIVAYATKQQIASAEDRKEMLVRALVGLDVRPELNDLRYDGFGYTSTHQMQTMLSAELRTDIRHEYFVPIHTPAILTEVWHVVGADNVDNIKEWNEGYDLWNRARFIVVSRPGHEPTELPPHSIIIANEAAENRSGTNIRALIAAKQPWEHLVSESVAAYIKERGLYQSLTQGEG
jgi:nicotinate (nicotinamide) nucleotide adenylyltransferase